MKVSEGKHWSDERILSKRAYFHLTTAGGSWRSGNIATSWRASVEEGAFLELKHVEENDQAFYRCRVDFLLSPTRNTIVNFTVVSKYKYYFYIYIKNCLYYLLCNLYENNSNYVVSIFYV